MPAANWVPLPRGPVTTLAPMRLASAIVVSWLPPSTTITSPAPASADIVQGSVFAALSAGMTTEI